MIHDLKIWPVYFEAVRSGKKRFEVRKTDRDFKEGDVIVLREYDADRSAYTGRLVAGRIEFVTLLAGLDPVLEGYCAFSFRLTTVPATEGERP